MVKHNLPIPDPTYLAHSEKLAAHIRSTITQAGGQISFADFMQLALYAPGLGYYSAGSTKLGQAGDFVTAPEISPLFSQCLAEQCQQVLKHINGGDILEFGAGAGSMAKDILLHLQQLNALPEHYFIIEVSADLKQRQQQLLQTLEPDLYQRVVWLDTLPTTTFQGVMLANEVLDAMPVHRFYCEQNQLKEYFIGLEDEQFHWQLNAPSQKNLLDALLQLQIELGHEFADGYESEINLLLNPWLNSLSDCLQQGLILIIDYGFPQAEYYHPQRNSGTLMCHYQHRAHSDPLLWPGLQDITAHVNFTAVAEAALAAQLDVLGYTSQAHFLLGLGITELAQSDLTQADELQRAQINQSILRLTQPHEMGELFKVMALGRELDIPLLGFKQYDLRNKL